MFYHTNASKYNPQQLVYTNGSFILLHEYIIRNIADSRVYNSNNDLALQNDSSDYQAYYAWNYTPNSLPLVPQKTIRKTHSYLPTTLITYTVLIITSTIPTHSP